MTMSRAQVEEYRARVRGCLLGGAVGDALGAPVEFADLDSIRRAHGAEGVREFVAQDDDGVARYGLITDDTQMTLFTVEGLIRAGVRRDRGLGFRLEVVNHAYDRWLDTQLDAGPTGRRDGWLQAQQWLYARRAPGNTCLRALTEVRQGGDRISPFGTPATNDSKGCGAVMRSAPFGLFPPHGRRPSTSGIFDMAAEAAGYTHGHPTGKLASGALAVIIAQLVAGEDLVYALDVAEAELNRNDHHNETSALLKSARDAATDGSVGPITVESLGGGWIAEEALAIAVYCALAYPEPAQFLDALSLAVTHSGDSDSTGAICGNILGALNGETALPPQLAFEVEGRGTILELADDLIWEFVYGDSLHGDPGPNTRWTDRYPGG